MGAAGRRLLPTRAGWLLVARRARAKSLKRIPAGLVISLCLIAGTAIGAFAFGARPGEMRDFEVYWTAAQRASEGAPLYLASDGHYQFKYLPAFALLATPLATLPLAAAKALWFTTSVALLVALLWLALACLREVRRPRALIIMAMIVAMGKFYGHELVLGQVNLLFAVIVTGALLLMLQRRDVAGTLLLVVAVVVKPYAVIFLPWVVWLRGRTALVATAAGIAAVLVLPMLVYGAGGAIALHHDWWITVTRSTSPTLTNADNVSIAAFFAKWLGIGTGASALAALISLALVALAVFVVARGGGIPHREVLEGSLLLTLVPLLSPQGWDYVFLVATPAIALLVNQDDHLPRVLRVATWAAILTIGLSLFDLIGRQRYATFMSWSVITVAFLVLLGSLTILRTRRTA